MSHHITTPCCCTPWQKPWRRLDGRLNDIVEHVFLFYYLAHEVHYLLAPPFPVVGRVEAPVVNPCWNILCSEYAVNLPCTVEQFVLPIALSHAHHYVALAVEVEIWVVGRHIGEIVLRGVVIYEQVVVVGEEIACIVYAAQ